MLPASDPNVFSRQSKSPMNHVQKDSLDILLSILIFKNSSNYTNGNYLMDIAQPLLRAARLFAL